MNEQEELRARLMKDFEAIIDRIVANKPASKEIALRYAKKTAMAAGEKLKEVIAQGLLKEYGEEREGVKCLRCGKRLKQAAARQMQLPNPPILYYGTEAGLSQDEGTAGPLGLQASRKPMLWGEAQDRELLDFYKMHIQARHARMSVEGKIYCAAMNDAFVFTAEIAEHAEILWALGKLT